MVPIGKVAELLMKVTGDIYAAEVAEARCCGVTRSQCRILLVLGREEGSVSLTDLSRQLDLDLSTVSRVAEGLFRQGFIVREQDENDRRKVCLSLTTRGRELNNTYIRNLSSYVHAIWDQIPSADRKIVLKGLDIILAAQEGCKEDCCSE